MSDIAGAVGSIAGVGVDIANMVMQGQQTQLDNQYRQNLFDYQKQRDAVSDNQWNIARQDSLHAVSNRMADLKSVGMSPLLAVGSAQNASVQAPVHSNVGSAQGGRAPQMNPSMMLAMAQIANTQAQTRNIDADTQNKQLTSGQILTGIELNKTLSDLNVQNTELSKASYSEKLQAIKESEARVENLISQKKLNDKNALLADAQAKEAMAQYVIYLRSLPGVEADAKLKEWNANHPWLMITKDLLVGLMGAGSNLAGAAIRRGVPTP